MSDRFIFPHTYIHFSIVVSHRQLPHEMHRALNMVKHGPAVPGAGIVYPVAVLVNRIPRNLLVVTARKRDIFLERKVSLFDTG